MSARPKEVPDEEETGPEIDEVDAVREETAERPPLLTRLQAAPPACCRTQHHIMSHK